jgi:DNA-binding LacI/PurR family transcriptional regulator
MQIFWTKVQNILKIGNYSGLKVPEDISIVGFDGLGHHLLTYPHITTVKQPIFKIGKMLGNIIKEYFSSPK